MVSKAITQQDLSNLELKISKEQTELRHEDRNKMQQYYNMVDDLKIDSALTNQALTTMNENFRELKGMVKSISDKIDKQEQKFATKEEHGKNETRIKEISNIVDGINMKIVYAT